MVDKEEPIIPSINSHSSSTPWGMQAYDRKALSKLQQESLNDLKTPELRHGSILYLATHPQVDAVASVILRAIFLHRPSNPKKFAAEVVKRPDFRDEIERYLVRSGPNRKKKRCPREDVYQCINPDLLTRKETDPSSKPVEVLRFPNWETSPWMELAESLISATSLSDIESVESLEVYVGKREDSSLRQSRIDNAMKESEELARKIISENIFKRKFFDSSEEYSDVSQNVWK